MSIDLYQESLTNPTSMAIANYDFPFTVNPHSRTVPQTDIIAIVSDGVSITDIEEMGIEIKEIIDNVIIGHGPIDDIIALANTDLTVQVAFPKELKPQNDKARTVSQIDDIHTGGDNLLLPYNGEGVIAGIFDIGMDPNHVNFKHKDGTSRILSLWVLHHEDIEKFDPSNIDDFTTDDPNSTHGTHTMGSLAGAYNGNSTYASNYENTISLHEKEPLPYYGMAPGTDILAATGQAFSTNIISGLRNIATRIAYEGRPGVLSLSFGDHLGPHDGTDGFTMALNNIAKQYPLFICAGNDGDLNQSLVGDFTDDITQYGTFLVPSSDDTAKGEIQIWAADEQPLTITLCIYHNTTCISEYDFDLGTKTLTTTPTESSSSIFSEDFANGFENSTVTITTNVNYANNRYNSSIRYSLNRKSSNFNTYKLGIIVKGSSGQHFDLVNNVLDSEVSLQKGNVEGFFNGNNSMSISNMACGPDMICIGAYNTRRAWGTIGYYIRGYAYNSGYDESQIAGYSSYGTLYNGTTLPVACAPGSGIISSVSQYWAESQNTDYMCAYAPNGSGISYWDVMHGTSMATPIAAGIAALWLQANPYLTPSDIKDIIKQTAINDGYVNSNDIDCRVAWGAGKIDALAGIKAAINLRAGIADVNTDPTKVLVTNGINGWCVTVPGATGVTARIFDINGRIVHTTTINGDYAEISTESLAPGIYIMQVNNIFTKRVVVK